MTPTEARKRIAEEKAEAKAAAKAASQGMVVEGEEVFDGDEEWDMMESDLSNSLILLEESMNIMGFFSNRLLSGVLLPVDRSRMRDLAEEIRRFLLPIQKREKETEWSR